MQDDKQILRLPVGKLAAGLTALVIVRRAGYILLRAFRLFYRLQDEKSDDEL